MAKYRPVAETADTVTLRRADYDAMVNALEEAADLATVREVAARVAAGEDEYVPTAVIERLAAGQHPVRVWREHRALTLAALARQSGIAQSYVSEVEHGKKPGSVRALAALAEVLRGDIEDLLAPKC
jgi:hypothetical protein